MNRPINTPPPQDPKDPRLGSDSHWEELRTLLREANQPELPSPEYLRALRGRALQRFAVDAPSIWQLLRERLAFWADGFSARSSIARVLQLAVAGAAGAVVALWVAQQAPMRMVVDQPGLRPRGSQTVAPGIAESPSGPQMSVPDEIASAIARAPGNLGTAGRELEATPVAGSAGKIEKSSPIAGPTASPRESPGAGMAGPRNAFDTADSTGQSGSFPTDNIFALLRKPPLSMEALASSKDSTSGRGLDSVLDEMAQLRYKFIINGDSQYLADATRIQATLVDALKDRPGGTGESAQMKSLKLLRQAESALQEKRYAQAIIIFNQVATEVPDGWWAFLAHYFIANIEYENLEQYSSALDEYRVCLEKFPAHFISEDKLNLIRTRVELLSQTSENDWEPLRLYNTAVKSSTLVAQQDLLDLLEKYPECRLAGQAAQKLTDLAASDLEGKYVDPDRVLQTLQRALNLNPSSTQAAAIQFAIADLFQQRLFKPGPAITSFQRVLQLNPSPELAAAANSRLQELSLMRFATPTP